jgi:hypothetical protein
LVLKYPRDVDESEINHPLLELCLTSTKGLGLFAKTAIKHGTCVLSEKPIIMVSTDSVTYESFLERLEELSEEQHNALYALGHNKKYLDPRMKTMIRKNAIDKGKFKKNKQALEIFVEAQLKGNAM